MELEQCIVLISPVFNEEKYIKKTIESVIQQTHLPKRWIIVDDDSTDNTASIIHEYAKLYEWIEYHHHSKEEDQSYFASNVLAISFGMQQLEEDTTDFIGILDGDIQLPSDYYRLILKEFSLRPQLGIASGIYVDNKNGELKDVISDRRSTPKAIQVFRSKCYDDIGGYLALEHGGEDTLTCYMARMKGWAVYSFPNIVAVHNKPIGPGRGKSILQIRFRQGLCDWGLGAHPLFMLLKSIKRMLQEYPIILSGVFRYTGYIYGHLSTKKRQVPKEVIQFIQREQMNRIIRMNMDYKL